MTAPDALHPTDQTLRAYGLGRLDEVSAGSVRSHLEGCPDCRRRVAQTWPETPRPAVSSAEGLSLLEAVAIAGPPPPVGALPPGLADDPDYEILRELGRGGMGVVYLAQNKLMGRREVLKVVGGHLISRPAVLERFTREIRSAARLHHPNIVTAYSAKRLGESLVLAMEYVEGSDLSRIVKERGPLPVAHACYFVYQAALGLQHAHEHGMVHRDIKPANLILARAGNKAIVKVLDFGLAKVSSEGQRDSGLTREGQMLGTPDYIAPEQIRDAQNADTRADIYSLGCTLYYLLTGRPPFTGGSLWDVYQAHLSTEASPLSAVRPGVPVELAAVVARMMAKDPDRRFQEPKEVAQALKPFFLSGDAASSRSKTIDLAGKPGVPPPVPATEFSAPAATLPDASAAAAPGEATSPGRPFVGSPASAIAAVAVAVLASLLTGVWVWMRGDRDQAGSYLASRAVETVPPPSPAPAPEPKATRPEPRPTAEDPEPLMRNALAAVRGGNVNEARFLLNQYLSRPGPRQQEDAARVLVREIDLAASSVEAESLARRLSDREIEGYLAAGGQPLVDRTVQTPELRPVYADTLLRSLRKESDRRQSAPKRGATLARGPHPPSPPTPKAPPDHVANEDRLPANLIRPDDDAPTAPTKPAARNGVTTIEMIADSSRSFEGRTISLEGLYKVGTHFTPIRGADGQPIGWSIPVGGGSDDRLICKGDGKIMGRNAYLILGEDLGTALRKAFDEYKFHPALRPTHKSVLTVTAHHMTVDGMRVPVVQIVGLEVLGACNFLHVAQRQYEKAFMTLRVTPGHSGVAYGDGAAWAERLGGEEKFVRPLRKKLHDLQKRAITDRTNAIVGNMLQAELGRSVNMAIASQQQQARFVSAFFGR